MAGALAPFDFFASDNDAAIRGFLKPGDDRQNCGLAASRMTENADELAFVGLESLPRRPPSR